MSNPNGAKLNAGKTIDHSIKPTSGMSSIPSYQHGKPYMLPDKKLPNSITYRKQQLFNLASGTGMTRVENVVNPKKVEQYTSNLNYAVGQLNKRM